MAMDVRGGIHMVFSRLLHDPLPDADTVRRPGVWAGLLLDAYSCMQHSRHTAVDRLHDRRAGLSCFQLPMLPHCGGISADIPEPMRMDIADPGRNSSSVRMIGFADWNQTASILLNTYIPAHFQDHHSRT